jgi:molecular chaperone DnaK (HSP70)
MTKLAALSLQSDSSIIMTVEKNLKTIIEKIQNTLKQKLNKTASKVIVSVPMMFTASQKGDFEQCLKKAGFKRIKFVDEISILSVAISEKVKKNKIALIGNWTDTHIELAVSEVGPDHVKILDKYGNFSVGAGSIKKKITRILGNKVLHDNQLDIDSISDEEAALFKDYAENVFETLIYETSIKVNINLSNPSVQKEVEVTRDEIEEKCDHPYSIVDDSIQNVVDRNPGVAIIWLNGKPFENPESIEEVKNKCGMKNVETMTGKVRPNVVTKLVSEDFKFTNSLYLSISMCAVDDKDFLVFPRGTSLPTQKKTICLYTAQDGQDSISFQFSEGQRIDFSQNMFLYEIEVLNLPKCYAKETGASCKVKIDKFGKLSIQASIIGTDGQLTEGTFHKKR